MGKVRRSITWASIIGGTMANVAITGGSITGATISAAPFAAVTDPAGAPTFAAVTTAIVDAYNGVVITLTGSGNAQTIQNPTVTTAGKIFTVVNNDTSTNTIAVNGITIGVGKSQSYIWDGSAWLPTDLGITAIPVIAVQGGTGFSSYTVGDILYANTTTTLARLAAVAVGSVMASAGAGAAPAYTTDPTVRTLTASERVSGTPTRSAGAAIQTVFAGTVTAAGSTTVTFSVAADAVIAGYHASTPTLGTTLISNGLTRHIISWTDSTTAVVDSAVTWAGTAITSTQFPISFEVNSSGVLKRAIYADGTRYPAVPITDGGTGKTTAYEALTAFDVGAAVVDNDGATLVVTDLGKTYICDSGSDQTFNLPSVDATNIGSRVTFIKIGSGKLTVDAADSDTIDDSSAGGTIYCNDAGNASITLCLAAATEWIPIAATNTWTTT